MWQGSGVARAFDTSESFVSREHVSVPPFLLDAGLSEVDQVSAEMLKPIVLMMTAVLGGPTSGSDMRVTFDQIVPDTDRTQYTLTAIVRHRRTGQPAVVSDESLQAIVAVSPIRIIDIFVGIGQNEHSQGDALLVSVVVQAHHAPLKNTLFLLQMQQRQWNLRDTGVQRTEATESAGQREYGDNHPLRALEKRPADFATATRLADALCETLPPAHRRNWLRNISISLGDSETDCGYTMRWQLPDGISVDGRMGQLLRMRFPGTFSTLLFELGSASVIDRASENNTAARTPVVLQIFMLSHDYTNRGALSKTVAVASAMTIQMRESDSDETWAIPVANPRPQLEYERERQMSKAADVYDMSAPSVVRPAGKRKRQDPTPTEPSNTLGPLGPPKKRHRAASEPQPDPSPPPSEEESISDILPTTPRKSKKYNGGMLDTVKGLFFGY